jgi:hypothetical protein
VSKGRHVDPKPASCLAWPPMAILQTVSEQSTESNIHYALEDLPNKVLAAEYRTTLPDEKTLVAEVEAKRRLLESRTKKGGRP